MIKGVEVVTLCGSTRFTREMMLKEWELTKQGKVVMGWCVLPTNHEADGTEIDHHLAEKEGVHEILDEMHKRKIDLSDRIHVMNIGGYIGEHTASEITYASQCGKEITFEEDA